MIYTKHTRQETEARLKRQMVVKSEDIRRITDLKSNHRQAKKRRQKDKKDKRKLKPKKQIEEPACKHHLYTAHCRKETCHLNVVVPSTPFTPVPR